MSFGLKRKETVPDGIRRVATERIERVLGALDGKGPAPDEKVHDARKRLKQVRGALRLVRGELGSKRFDRENRTYREAGRPLSEVRDAKVLLDTLDELAEHYKEELATGAFQHPHSALQARRQEIRKRVLGDSRTLRPIVSQTRQSLRRVPNWPLKRKGWKAIVSGLCQTYVKGRTAMEQAIRAGSDEAFHEWRKRTKDLRYEIELLVRVWPETMQPMADAAHHLTDLLGKDHDLVVLQQVEGELQDVPADPERELLEPLISQRREELQKEARELGCKLYAESDDEFVDRIHQYWKEWR